LKSFNAKPGEVERNWFVVDANGHVLGRLASFVAARLRGKHKAIFTPHCDTGDFIVIVNAEKIRLTGKKLTDKLYRHHTTYMGGLKTINAQDLLKTKPERLLELAVKRMLPNTVLGRNQFRKLKVYAGSTHPHEAQQPQPLPFIQE
jgi:large subunit ribosomal protein L13